MTPELALIVALGIAVVGPLPKTWIPVERALNPKLGGTDPATYEVMGTGPLQGPVDFGLEWAAPQRIGEMRFGFASLGGRVYEPSVRKCRLEARLNGFWTPVRAHITVDYSKQGTLAPIQGRGFATWTFRFKPLEADAVRLFAGGSAHDDPGFQCIALSPMSAGPGGAPVPERGVDIVGSPPSTPPGLEQGANLADPRSGATVVKGEYTTFRRSQPALMNCVRVPAGGRSPEIEFEASPGVWRPVAQLRTPAPGIMRFNPVATTGLRIHTRAKCTVCFDQGGRAYFRHVRQSPEDVLGKRFRNAKHRDLAEMRSYLLPIDFAKTAIGRPSDLHETMVTWTGTFLMVESAGTVDPQTGAKLPAQQMDRWFAPVAAKGPFGDDWTRVHSHYLDGWMPAVTTEYEEGGLSYRQTVFVTSPDRKLYGNVAVVEVANGSNTVRRGGFAFAMGRRPMYGDPWTPFSQDPQATGYRLDPDCRTVRDARGSIMLQAAEPGRWQGTPRENRLAYSFKLEPGARKSLSFFIPSVDAPLSRLPAWDSERELQAFRSWWFKLMAGVAQIDVPEKPINDLTKNLLAQALIITLDGDQVRYGAYAYECYFGVEEGWPAVALAQYGFGDTAKRITELMLSPELMDKSNYHHQYRNGLDPWYAITVARLTGDWDWLRRRMPMIRACADWTLKVTAENKDPRFSGLLPKHVYGGDVGMPAYSFYSNATCYRGLHDTGVALSLIDDEKGAASYLAAAAAYRSRLLLLADELVESTGGRHFLPMAFDLDAPSGHRDAEPAYPFLATHAAAGDTWGTVGNYWNLFAPLLHEVRLFSVGDPRSRWIPDFVEHRGGLLAGLARFDLGLDHIYGKGYIESLLDAGRREEFLTSLYSLIANGMSRNLFSSPEVSGVFPLRTDNSAMALEHQRERWNWLFRPIGGWMGGWQNQEGEPLSAGAGMALQLVRLALVREDNRSDPPNRLLLLDGASAHWFCNRMHVAVDNMRTFFGPVSFRVDAGVNRFTAKLSLPQVDCVLRLPHPGGLKLAAVTVNGVPWSKFRGNEIEGLRGAVRLQARFRK